MIEDDDCSNQEKRLHATRLSEHSRAGLGAVLFLILLYNNYHRYVRYFVFPRSLEIVYFSAHTTFALKAPPYQLIRTKIDSQRTRG